MNDMSYSQIPLLFLLDCISLRRASSQLFTLTDNNRGIELYFFNF